MTTISGPKRIGIGLPVHPGIRAGGLGGGVASGIAADLALVLNLFNYSIRRPTFNEQEDPGLSSAGEVFMIERGTALHGAVVLEGEKATVLSLGRDYQRSSLYECFTQIFKGNPDGYPKALHNLKISWNQGAGAPFPARIKAWAEKIKIDEKRNCFDLLQGVKIRKSYDIERLTQYEGQFGKYCEDSFRFSFDREKREFRLEVIHPMRFAGLIASFAQYFEVPSRREISASTYPFCWTFSEKTSELEKFVQDIASGKNAPPQTQPLVQTVEGRRKLAFSNAVLARAFEIEFEGGIKKVELGNRPLPHAAVVFLTIEYQKKPYRHRLFLTAHQLELYQIGKTVSDEVTLSFSRVLEGIFGKSHKEKGSAVRPDHILFSGLNWEKIEKDNFGAALRQAMREIPGLPTP